MKTLTITDARKNLGKWLKAAARGEEVGIVSGSDIIALHKVEVAAVDAGYSEAEYGANPQALERLEKAVSARYRKQRRAGSLLTLEDAEKALAKADAH